MLDTLRTAEDRIGTPQFALSGVNWLGFRTLYEKEIRRFLKVYQQTLFAPVITTLLYLVVLLLARGGTVGPGGQPYGSFLAPGLIMMTIAQSAFAHTSSSIMVGKMQGSIVDLLMPPLSSAETVLALALAGATRGVLVGIAVGLSVMPFVSVHIVHWAPVLAQGVLASLLLSTIGILGGLWAEKFEHQAAVTNFVVMPLSFLSGTFYSVDALPPTFRLVVRLDPFFYMIDGFRYGFLGRAETSPAFGLILMIGLNLALLLFAWRLFVVGYKLKA